MAVLSSLFFAVLAPVAAYSSSLRGCGFPDAEQQGAAGSVKIACVGDSITAGAHSSSRNMSYPSQLQASLDKDYGTGAYAVTNLGHCAATMVKAGNLPYWKTGQYRTLTSNKWDIVVIMLGTNDAKDNSSSHGKFNNWQHDCGGPDRTTLNGCSFATDYSSMVEMVRTLGAGPGGPKIFAVVPPPLMHQGDYGMNQTVINSLFPKLFPLIQKDTGILGPIDVFSGMGGIANWQSQYPASGCTRNTTKPASCSWFCDEQSCDQCHPNDNGYTQFAKIVQAGLDLVPAPAPGSAMTV